MRGWNHCPPSRYQRDKQVTEITYYAVWGSLPKVDQRFDGRQPFPLVLCGSGVPETPGLHSEHTQPHASLELTRLPHQLFCLRRANLQGAMRLPSTNRIPSHPTPNRVTSLWTPRTSPSTPQQPAAATLRYIRHCHGHGDSKRQSHNVALRG